MSVSMNKKPPFEAVLLLQKAALTLLPGQRSALFARPCKTKER
jgi:hypothetical protein